MRRRTLLLSLWAACHCLPGPCWWTRVRRRRSARGRTGRRACRVEGLDDVVAVAPGGGEEVVGLEAGGVGVAHQVEPVAAPALAVAGRFEQAVDQLFIARRWGTGPGRRRRPPRGWAAGRGGRSRRADEGAAVGRFGAGWMPPASELGQDKGVDRIRPSRGAGGQAVAQASGRTTRKEPSGRSCRAHGAPASIQARRRQAPPPRAESRLGGMARSPLCVAAW
jgi:hypothetical protein